jgi:hypothetical protein
VSLAEIIDELPRLNTEERLIVLQRLRQLTEQDDLQFLHEAADSMFQVMDEQESNDAARKTR